MSVFNIYEESEYSNPADEMANMFADYGEHLQKTGDLNYNPYHSPSQQNSQQMNPQHQAPSNNNTSGNSTPHFNNGYDMSQYMANEFSKLGDH